MKKFSSSAAKPPSEAERALQEWGVTYEKKPDGTIVVPGNLMISDKGLTQLPDLTNVIVLGCFYCENNKLKNLDNAPRHVGLSFSCSGNKMTSLRGAPLFVGGSFWCDDNQLTSLEHMPQSVALDIFCSNNQLTSLKHAPRATKGGFYCDGNRLESLEHGPETVNGDFSCIDNRLVTLEHAPRSVTNDFCCRGNRLVTLEHAPQTFTQLISDFGTFKTWDEVPDDIKASPETRERVRQEELETVSQDATTLSGVLKVSPPLRLKK